MKKLSFVRKMSVSQFKAEKQTSELRALRNPKTGKLFLTDEVGNVLGVVSETALGHHSPVVSQVSNEEGETFFIMHKMHENPEILMQKW